jgi:hypothetical protein
VYLTGEILSEYRYASVFGSQMRVIVSAIEKSFCTISTRDYSENTAHLLPPYDTSATPNVKHQTAMPNHLAVSKISKTVSKYKSSCGKRAKIAPSKNLSLLFFAATKYLHLSVAGR